MPHIETPTSPTYLTLQPTHRPLARIPPPLNRRARASRVRQAGGELFMVAEAAETFGFERGEGEVDFDGEGVEEGAEPELCWFLSF